MISTLLAVHPWVTTVGLLVAIVIGLPLGYWLVRASRGRLAWVLAAIAFAAVLAVTLYPVGRGSVSGCVVDQSFSTIGTVEATANVILFVPVVLLTGVATRRPWLVLLGGSVLSAAIELTQAVAPALGRSCTANDWLENTLGAVLGAVLAAIAIRLAGRRAGIA